MLFRLSLELGHYLRFSKMPMALSLFIYIQYLDLCPDFQNNLQFRVNDVENDVWLAETDRVGCPNVQENSEIAIILMPETVFTNINELYISVSVNVTMQMWIEDWNTIQLHK